MSSFFFPLGRAFHIQGWHVHNNVLQKSSSRLRFVLLTTPLFTSETAPSFADGNLLASGVPEP